MLDGSVKVCGCALITGTRNYKRTHAHTHNPPAHTHNPPAHTLKHTHTQPPYTHTHPYTHAHARACRRLAAPPEHGGGWGPDSRGNSDTGYTFSGYFSPSSRWVLASTTDVYHDYVIVTLSDLTGKADRLALITVWSVWTIVL